MNELKARPTAPGGTPQGDLKRTVCRALTGVLRQSPLAAEIDPKSFYMMLSSNFALLFQHGTLDLDPVWQALATGRPTHPLYGLFLRFEEEGRSLGFQVRQPQPVLTLTQEQRMEFLGLARVQGAATEVLAHAEEDEEYRTDPNAVAIPLSLGTGDVKPFIPDELRRQVVHAVVQSLKVAPVGQMLDAAQLAFLVDSNFDQLCDGINFDFAPIHGGLRQLEGVKDSDLFVGVARLEQALGQLNLALKPIHLDVEPALAQRLLEDLEAKERAAAAAAATEVVHRARGGERPPPPAPTPAPTTPLEVPKGGDARERRLRKWGLLGMSPRAAKVVRLVALTVVLGAAGATAFFLRPNRGLDPSDYAGTLPIKTAELRDGVFQAVVDDTKWWSLDRATRAQRLEAFEKILRAQGRIPNAQIRDTRGRLVVTGVGGRKLASTKYFAYGFADGTIAEEDRSPTPEAPPEPKEKAP
jgi:hypothetical protein